MGSWDGRFAKDLMEELGLKEYRDLEAHLPEDAENNDKLRTRAVLCLQEILETYDGEILLISHGGLFREFCRELTGKTAKSGNAQPHRFEYKGDTWQVDPLR